MFTMPDTHDFDFWPDNRDDWKPVWKDKTSPHAHQETHSPTEEVSLRQTGERETTAGRRRLVDARLWAIIPPSQQDAALEIEHAVTVLTSGLGIRPSSVFQAPVLTGKRGHPPPRNMTDFQAERIQLYFAWAREAEKESISHAAILDVLVFGQSCRKVDKARRVRNGWARGNLLDGLALYCQLRGWPEQ